MISLYSEAKTSIFTTKQSGEFDDASTWSSGTVPGPMDRIVVATGHILTINIDTPELTQVAIQAGGEIRGDGTGKVLTLANGPGHGLQNDGTINFSASQAATIRLATNAKWHGTGIYNLSVLDLNTNTLSFTSNGKYTINLSGARPILNPGMVDGKSKILFRFNGSEAQTLPAAPGIQYGEIEITNPAGVYLEGDLTGKNLVTHLTVASGFLHMNGYQIHGRPGASLGGQTLKLEAGTSLIVDGASAFPDNFHHYVLDPASTVRYTGGHTQTIKALNYGHLEISGKRGGSTVYFETGQTGVAGTLAASATFTSGGYRHGISVLALNGAGNQAIELENQELALHGLAILGGGTKSLSGEQNLKVKNLVLQNGLLATSLTNNIKILAGGTVTGANSNSYVWGNLSKQVPQGLQVAMNYEVGDATGYNPVTFTFPTVATSGAITAGLFPAATGDQHGSRIKPENRINKTWKIAREGLAPAVYNATFRYTQQEVKAGSMDKYEVNVFSPDTYERIKKCDFSQSSVTINNASAFGYVQIGEINLVTVNTKLFLQGPYAGGKKMRVNLSHVLPLTQPFAHNFGYHGNETVADGFFGLSNSLVDWVLLELRTSPEPHSVVARKACLLREDGQLVEADGSTLPSFFHLNAGDYYIVVRHRNHLSVMSGQPVALQEISAEYDFSTHPNQYYGGQAALLEAGVYGLYAGDANGTDLVTFADYILINAGLNQSGYLNSDLDLSGFVDMQDRNLFFKNLNKKSKLP